MPAVSHAQKEFRPMDLSVAPELAQFAQAGPVDDPLTRSGTLGDRAAELAELAADPRRWWDRVRFDPGAPVRVVLDGVGWLLVVPPGGTAECDCELATLVAGEAAEDGHPLRPGRTRVHGRRGNHTIRSSDAGYAVTWHMPFPPDGGRVNHPAG
jgi:hypothetical protein